MRNLKILVAVLVLCALASAGDKKYANLSFLVVKDLNGKPVRNALVVLHPVDKHGHSSRSGPNLKTDLEGKTRYDGVPYGKLRIQVIAPGFQTYGEDYDINQAEMLISVRMKPPAEQITIYGDKDKKPDDKKPDDKKDEQQQPK
jgi:hypothetical protein